MKEAQEISDYIAERMEFWQNRLKHDTSDSMRDWTRGQIYEAERILKHIQDEYGINPNIMKEA